MVVGTDVCVCVVFLFGDIVLPGGNSPAQLDDHMTISHVMMSINLCCSCEGRAIYHCASPTAVHCSSHKLHVHEI